MLARAERVIPLWAALLILVVLAITMHAPIIGCTFFSDDFQVLYRLKTQGSSTFFRPLADWSLRINLAVAEPEPWAVRIVNVALLGVNAWLVFLLAKRLLPQAMAFFAGLLFVLYPFHMEPQVWIIGRGAAMATSFILLALIVATSKAQSVRKAAGVGALGLLGSLCYESALLLPLMVGAWWLLLRPSDSEGWRWAVLASGLVVALNLVLRWLLSEHITNEYGAAFFAMDPLGYPAMLLKVIGRSSLPPNESPSAQTARFAALGLALLAAGAWFWIASKKDIVKRRHALLLIVLFGIGSLVAVVGGVSTRTSESDRFLYLPSAFLSILLVLILSQFSSPRWRHLVLGLLLVASIVGLRRSQANWIVASRTIERIIASVPQPPKEGRLFVHGLPGEHRGAFIFRHGFHEALLFAGRDTTGILRADTLVGTRAVDCSDRRDTLEVRERDRIVHWAGERFKDLPVR
ncbi:MAG: glycosyltransferase family 39 protein [Flavobacteriales bacterium]|nr:glycosyltransferase family 39 protein [Flavobacteriales bacterium]